MLRILYYFTFMLLIFTGIICTKVLAAPVIEWNTFWGSADDDYGRSVATDNSGNVYMAGESEDTWGTPIRPFGAVTDVAVAKFDANGVLQWNTFLGTSVSNDYNASITTDGNGNVYVTGTSNNTWGSPINPPIIGANVFLAKLNSNGVLQWNTFIPGYSDPYQSIAVDINGNVYLTGYSYDWGTPINPHAGAVDVFVAKFDSSGALQWHTFMGQTFDDADSSLTLDAAGNVYVSGYSQDTWGTPINPPSGWDPFVAKLNANGILQWNTFLDEREIRSIATDGSDGIFVAGRSTASWGTPISPYSGLSDGFVAKLNSSGVYQWHTYMGSSGDESLNAISIDANDNIYVAGESSTTWGTPVNPYSGGIDGFVVKLNSSGVLQWHTFFGSPSEDGCRSLAAEDNGNIHLTGHSLASWGTPVNPWNLYRDILVLKVHDTDFDDLTPPTVDTTIPANAATNVAVNATISAIFSEDMDVLTIDTNTFSLDNGVTGVVSYDTNSKTATFTPSADLAYNTTYIATITTGAQDQAGNALQTDYSWSFDTSSVPDTTPPSVSSTSPADSASNVAVNTTISANFSEAMDAGTITTATFTVNDGAGNIAGSVTYSGTTATFTPTADLNYSTTYTVTITTGAQDQAGNAMQTEYSWSFTTGSAPDTTPPTVSETLPADNQNDVPLSTTITVQFSEQINASCINTNSFTLDNGVTGTVTYDGSSRTATFTPSTDLDFDTNYIATITTDVEDLALNRIQNNYTWTFTTEDNQRDFGSGGCVIVSTSIYIHSPIILLIMMILFGFLTLMIFKKFSNS